MPEAAELARNDQAAERALAEMFSGEQLAEGLATLRESLGSRSAVEYTYAGGAEDFEYSSVSVEGDTATVSASVRTWTTFVLQGNGHLDVASPSNLIEVDAVLALREGAWKVTRRTWDFAPGESP